MRVTDLVRGYLNEAKLMQLSTVCDGKPWASNLWYVSDDDWNLFFHSHKGRRHCVELQKNPVVAGTIVKPFGHGRGETVVGLQFEGTAQLCESNMLQLTRERYLNKYPDSPDIALEELQDPGGAWKFFSVKPSMFVLYDERHFPDDPRQELRL